MFSRSADFRTDYGRLGELRALIPSSVHIMALTATATMTSREKIIRSLHMEKPVIFSASPHKKNIIYTLRPKPDIEVFVGSVIDCLKKLRTNMPRTIIFCRRYKECADMYSMFKQSLNTEFTDPPNAPDLVKYRVVDMYTKCTEASIKEDIIMQFSKCDSTLRIIIATIAFGMGLDCPDVRQIFHWGASNDIESYIQETGRCGRDGYTSNAVLFHSKSDERLLSPLMIGYCHNDKMCRRERLFSDFDGSDMIKKPCSQCLCCDICALSCKCGSCCLIHYAFSHIYK